MTSLQLIIDGALVVGLLALAVGSLVAHSLVRCVVLFMTFGLIMAFTWARLGAPDIALVEVAIGSGITGVLLLSTISILRTHESDTIKGGN